MHDRPHDEAPGEVDDQRAPRKTEPKVRAAQVLTRYRAPVPTAPARQINMSRSIPSEWTRHFRLVQFVTNSQRGLPSDTHSVRRTRADLHPIIS